MKKLLVTLSVFLLSVVVLNAQTIGKTKTEEHKIAVVSEENNFLISSSV
jgi:hypothetical protein